MSVSQQMYIPLSPYKEARELFQKGGGLMGALGSESICTDRGLVKLTDAIQQDLVQVRQDNVQIRAQLAAIQAQLASTPARLNTVG